MTLTELLGAALLDMNWHGISEAVLSVEDFEAAALKKEGLDLPAVPPRYRSSYFAHIFGGGYAAGVLRLPVDANAGRRRLSVVCRAGRVDP